ncbi:SDR family oxidoreductase [Pseudomonas sp. LS1212]|nr:SDR family oxidoreductase [Pseudomonas sp. LS1212]UVJ46356.1 SDR family oxidoreductase [Pseudomonas sp. LS1212]
MTAMQREFPKGEVLVIGGSGGAGEAICTRFAELGSDVILTYHRNEARAAHVVANVEALGRRAQAYQLSMSDLPGARRVIETLLGEGRVHTVVIAAGSDISQPKIRDLSVEDWRAVIDADLNGFFNIVQATLPHLKANGGGSYVHVSSAGLHRWPEGDVLSVVPKAAIDSMLKLPRRKDASVFAPTASPSASSTPASFCACGKTALSMSSGRPPSTAICASSAGGKQRKWLTPSRSARRTGRSTRLGKHFPSTADMASSHQYEVNQVGCWLGMKAVLPAMKEAGRGSIVNVSSTAGMEGVAGGTAYVASKFAVRGMTKAAALEFGGHNIRVNSVHPGGIDTAMARPPEFADFDAASIYRGLPIPRIGHPDEVANLVLFLACEESTYCTGAEFIVDGGMLAGNTFG